jgi:hypothetical protein
MYRTVHSSKIFFFSGSFFAFLDPHRHNIGTPVASLIMIQSGSETLMEKELHVSPTVIGSLQGDIPILCCFHLRITQHCRSSVTIHSYSVADPDPDSYDLCFWAPRIRIHFL